MSDATLLVDIKAQVAGLKSGMAEAEQVVQASSGRFQNLGKVSTKALKQAESSTGDMKKAIQAPTQEVSKLGGMFTDVGRVARGLGGIFSGGGAAEGAAAIAAMGVATVGLSMHTADTVVQLKHLSD